MVERLELTGNFFTHFYILDHNDPNLDHKDRTKALVASVALGLLTAGLVHLGCLIARECVAKPVKPEDGTKPADKKLGSVAQEAGIKIKGEGLTIHNKAPKIKKIEAAEQAMSHDVMTRRWWSEELKPSIEILMKGAHYIRSDFRKKISDRMQDLRDNGESGKKIGPNRLDFLEALWTGLHTNTYAGILSGKGGIDAYLSEDNKLHSLTVEDMTFFNHAFTDLGVPIFAAKK